MAEPVNTELWKQYNGKGFAAEYAEYAERANKDVDGNAIVDTYATKAELPDITGKADKATTLAGYGITDAYTKTETGTLLDGKVDTVSGKGLSTNDFTDTDKENATKASIIPANASATSSLTCTAANTFVWAGWEQKDVEVPPVIKKYLGIAYRDYTRGVSLLPNKYSPYSTDIRNFLDNPTYSELKSYHMAESAGEASQIGTITTAEVLNLWNQDKAFTLEAMFHTNYMSGSIGWSRRGYSGGGTPLLIKDSSFIVQFDAGNVYIRTINAGLYTDRATFPVYISGYTWHHIAITYDSSSQICTVFIDGTKVGSATITWSHVTEETFVTTLGSTVTQVAVYDYVAYDDNFTVPTIPHIYNSEYALKS